MELHDRARAHVSTNGSNVRLDRIERLLDGLAKTRAQDRVEFKNEIAESRAEFKREMAEHRRQINADVRMTHEDMRRWAALGVTEAHNQRKRSQKLDADIGRLVSSQLETEAMLKRLISSMGNSRNGGPNASN
jgi:hypothetical protein